MPTSHVPKLCHHKPSDRAYVTIDGREIYLGRFNSPDSRKRYARLIAEWAGAGERLPITPDDITIVEICARFIEHAATFYRHADGTPTGEADNFTLAMRPLKELYGDLPAREFSPLKLKAIQSTLIGKLTRTGINARIGRIKMILKWAAGNELVPAQVHHAIQTVTGLKRGRSEAKESDRVVPVPTAHIDKVIPLVSAQVAAMIQLQLFTGARAGEIITMRTGDIDRTGNVWTYTPASHKTEHHGHTRQIFLGAQAQKIITPFLKLDPTAFIFSPADAEADRREREHRKRKTALSCGNVPGSNKRRYPKRPARDHYDVNSYRRAIARACDRADAQAKAGKIIGNDERIIPRWHPHQLRHNAATELRKQFGIEAAQVMLGHKKMDVTAIYAEKNFDAARKIAAQVG